MVSWSPASQVISVRVIAAPCPPLLLLLLYEDTGRESVLTSGRCVTARS